MAATVLVVTLLTGWGAYQFGVKSLLVLPIVGIVSIIMVRPIVGLVLIAILLPMENLIVIDLGALGPTTWARAVGVVVFAIWGLHKLVTRSSWSTVFSARILKPALFFVVLMFASLLWGGISPAAFERITTMSMLLLLSLVVIDVINSSGNAQWLVRALVTGGLIAILLTVQQVIADPTLKRAGENISGGVNATAVTFVILTPISFYLLRASESYRWRVLGLGYIALAPMGVAWTLSRTSFVMLLLAFGTQIREIFRGGFRSLALVSLGLVVAGGVLITVVDWGIVVARGSTISASIQGERTLEGRLQSSRIEHWLGAILIFKDHPIAGVGVGNFGIRFSEYQFLVPENYVQRFYKNEGRSPHSSFLGILAELGIIGGSLWIWLVLVGLQNARQSWKRSKDVDNRSLGVLSQAVFFSLLLYAAYSLVSVVHVDKLLWILLGLSEVLRRLTPILAETLDPSSEALHSSATG
jgi:O-antigen ligase